MIELRPLVIRCLPLAVCLALGLAGFACDDGETEDSDTAMADVIDDGGDSTGDAATTGPDGDTGGGDVGPLCGFEACAAGQACCDFTCVDSASDPGHCGACGVVCATDESCVDGGCTCGDTSCSSAERCCDDAGTPACIAVETDPTNCGGCGVTCDPAEVCAGGSCACPGRAGAIEVCSASDSCCPGTGCVSLQDDPLNCGGCGAACGDGELCVAGQCVCGATTAEPGLDACGTDEACCGTPATCRPLDAAECQCGTTLCGSGEACCTIDDGGTPIDACVSTWRSDAHCGTCGNACADGERCRYGGCRCQPGRADCDSDPSNGCESPLAVDPANCGACGTSCGAGERCAGDGTCELTCLPGFTDCDGECVDLDWDRENCGACGNECAPGEVANGAGECTATCLPGFTDCGGECVNLLGNSFHCGVCGAACAPGQVCNGSGLCSLSCQVGFERCGSECVDLTWDRLNCGACGIECAAGEVCDSGACTLGCPPGYTECNGGCVDLDTNPVHCGACGTSCGIGERCVDGLCGVQCPPGLLQCAGDCIDPRLSSRHCGACGNACADDERCANAECVFAGCAAGFTRCGNQCVDLLTSPVHCGACDNSCNGEECRLGACCPPGGCGAPPEVFVSRGGESVCAVRNGELSCWGRRHGTTFTTSNTPQAEPLTDDNGDPVTVVEAALSASATCVRSTTDDVLCWGGAPANGSPTPLDRPDAALVVSGTPLRQLAASSNDVCSLDQSGQVTCWGSNNAGELGTNPGSIGPTRVPAADGAFRLAPNGPSSWCGLYARSIDNTSTTAVSCWGQTPDGATDVVPQTWWLRDVAGELVTDVLDLAPPCVITGSGEILCIGPPEGTTCTPGPCPVDAAYPRSLATGETVGGWRELSRPIGACALSVEGDVYCRGDAFTRWSGNPELEPLFRASGERVSNIGSLATGGTGCVVDSVGVLSCWAIDPPQSQLGALGRGWSTGDPTSASMPIDLGSDGARLHDAGHCAETANGPTLCWGFGIPDTVHPVASDSLLPTGTTDLAVQANLNGASPTIWTACAVAGDGSVQCIGRGNRGQLGNGCTVGVDCPSSQSPTTTFGPVAGLDGTVNAEQVVGSNDAFCARLTDGTVWCWGDNGFDDLLGDDTIFTTGTPIQVGLAEPAAELAAGPSQRCVRLMSGAVACWGDGYSGIQSVPTLDGTTESAVSISVDATGVAVLADGRVVRWSPGAVPEPIAGFGPGEVVATDAVSTGDAAYVVDAGGALHRAWYDDGAMQWVVEPVLDLDGSTRSVVDLSAFDGAALILADDGQALRHTSTGNLAAERSIIFSASPEPVALP